MEPERLTETMAVNDDQRERWDINRVRKNRSEKIRAIAMIAGLVSVICTLIFIPVHILQGAAGDVRGWIEIVLELIMCVLMVIGIYRRNMRLLIAAAVLWVIYCIIAGGITLHALPVSVGLGAYAAYEWQQLETEEGFPDFDISRLEREQRDRMEQMMRSHTAALQQSAAPTRKDMDII